MTARADYRLSFVLCRNASLAVHWRPITLFCAAPGPGVATCNPSERAGLLPDPGRPLDSRPVFRVYGNNSATQVRNPMNDKGSAEPV